MKVLKLLDFLGQTIILAWMILAQVFGIITLQFDIVAAAFIWAAAGLGPWQMISSFITTLGVAPMIKLRVVHLVTASVYLFTMNWLPTIVLYAVPAILAIIYYAITVETFRGTGWYPKIKHFFIHNFHKFLKV